MRIFLVSFLAALSYQAQPTVQSFSAQVRPFIEVGTPVVALQNVRVIDGTGASSVESQSIVLRNGRIAAIGDSADQAIPPEAEVLDLSGHTVIPGLVMLHEHFFYPVGKAAYNQQEFSFPRLYLAGGATSVRTAGSRDPYGDLNLKKAIDAGRVPGPKIHVTGPYLNAPGLPILFVNHLDGPEDARRMVSFWADQGATSFKAYMHVSRAELKATIDEAHQRGIKVTAHLCSVTYAEAADLGIDNLEHGLFASTDFVEGKQPDRCPSAGQRTRSLLDLDPTGPKARKLIGHLVEHEVALTSTLPVFEISTPGRPRAPSAVLDAMTPVVRDRYLRIWSTVSQNESSPWRELFKKGMEFERAFAEAGGLLVVGTDPTGYGGVVAGFANHRAVELLVEAGFNPEEAIKISSLNGAIHLGIQNEVGTISVGKAADLIVINGNPAANIQDIRKVKLVFKDGIGFDSKKLLEAVKGTVGLH